MRELIGQTHTKLLNWLDQDWLHSGSAICFLEGFPGVGKSSLASALTEKVEGRDAGRGDKWTAVKVDMPEGANAVNDLLLRLGEELSWAGHDKVADAVKEGKSLEDALRVVLRRPILIVIDEFQRALLPETGQPVKALEDIFQKIANRPNILGRLLLLTNRLVERDAPWAEPYDVQRLPAMEILEAEQLLGQRLKEARRETHVPIERRRDVVNWLGLNPRAMEVLVGCLKDESLDDLIGLNPESWELKDRDVSEDFVYRLERRLLERTLKQISLENMLFMKQLAVYRKPFKRKAMESLLEQPKKEFVAKSGELTNRFLLERPDRQWYSLHPVARSIVLQKLKDESEQWKLAHSKAADFYLQPFSKPENEGSKLGGAFLEARYHLVQSGREKELGKIVKNFEQYLKATTRSKRSIPKDRQELDENILVFSVLVEAINSEELECYLVWLFQARRKEGDLVEALKHTKRATSSGLGVRVTSWLLRVDLELQLHDPETALKTCQEGIDRIGLYEEVEQLYDRCTELLNRCNRLDDAMKLLENGIQKAPTGLGLAALYRHGTKLLTQAQEIEQAVIWLKQGIRQIDPKHGVVELYQNCAELLYQLGQVDKAVNLLEEGIERVSPEHGLNQLYKCCGDLLVKTNRLPEAVNILKEGIHNIPSEHDPFVLYERCAELLIQSGYADKAVDLLQDSFRQLPITQSQIPLYERWGDLLATTGNQQEAIALLMRGIETIPAIRGPVSLYLACGKLLAASGQVESAANLLEQGIKRIPSEHSQSIIWEECADLLVQLGQQEKAISVLKDGIENIHHHEGRYKLYIHCAELLELSNQINDAASLLKEGISRITHDETCKKLYLGCTNLLVKRNFIDEAISLLLQGIERIPAESDVQSLYVRCGGLLVKSDRVDNAIIVLKQGIDRIPPEYGVESLYLRLANLLEQTNRVDEAISLLQKGIEKSRTDSILHIRLANLLEQTNRVDEAYSLLQKGIENVPNNDDLYIRLANLLAQTNRIDEAISLLQKGIEKSPTDGKLYINLSNLLAQTNRIDEAIALSKKGIEMAPNNGDLYIRLSNLLEQTNRVDEAIALSKKGIEMAPNNGGLYIRLSNLLEQTNRVDEAIALLQKGIENLPHEQSHQLYMTASKVFVKYNQLENSIQFLKEGIQRIPIGHKNRFIISEILILHYLATNKKTELEEVISGTGENQLEPQSLALAKILLAQTQENWQRAAEISTENVAQFPTYAILIAHAALSLFSAGNPKAARKILQELSFQFSKGNIIWWLKALIDLKNNDLEDSKTSLENYLRRTIQVQTELTENFLLALWDNPSDFELELDIAYFFPTLPPTITGLDRSITRLQFSPPILINYQLSTKTNSITKQEKIETFSSSSASPNKPDIDSFDPTNPVILEKITLELVEIRNLMSETPKQAPTFNFYGQVGNLNASEVTNQRDQVGTQNNYALNQNLAEAAAAIQQLLDQLAKTNPTSTEAEKKIFVSTAINSIKNQPTLKDRAWGALKAGSIEAVKAIANHPAVSIPVEVVKGWIEAEPNIKED
jgi:tetratricopeptide (TPR) repeat protein